MEITLEMRHALDVVAKVYDQKIAAAFEIGVLNDWLKVTITPQMFLWEPLGPGTQIFDEIEQGSNAIMIKR